MTDKKTEALKLALEALNCNDYLGWQTNIHVRDAIREALAEQPEYRAVKTWHDGKPVYVAEQPAQPSKPWVGLTDDEIIHVIHPLVMADMADEVTDYEIARAIEAKLREKNA